MTVAIESKKKALLEQYDEKRRIYESFLAEIEHQVKGLLLTSHIPYNSITPRLKTRDSLAEKIERKQYKYNDLDEVTDIAGVRVITYYANDVDKVSKIIESEFDVDKENSIDKRTSIEPDRFGYCSVHYVVSISPARLALKECHAYAGMKCEIQIRTVLQHAWAEIEHDIGYKSEITIPKEMRRSFSRIAGLLEIADKEFDNIRQDLGKYKDNATQSIGNENFLDFDINAVVLDVLMQSNSDIQRINKHIQDLTGTQLYSNIDSSYYESTIKRLHWLGIETVRQIYELIHDHTENAIAIATKKLNNYKTQEDPGRISTLVAFFYLCYAFLLHGDCSKEKIYNYLVDTHIGRPGEQRHGADELLQLKSVLSIN